MLSKPFNATSSNHHYHLIDSFCLPVGLIPTAASTSASTSPFLRVIWARGSPTVDLHDFFSSSNACSSRASSSRRRRRCRRRVRDGIFVAVVAVVFFLFWLCLSQTFSRFLQAQSHLELAERSPFASLQPVLPFACISSRRHFHALGSFQLSVSRWLLSAPHRPLLPNLLSWVPNLSLFLQRTRCAVINGRAYLLRH